MNIMIKRYSTGLIATLMLLVIAGNTLAKENGHGNNNNGNNNGFACENLKQIGDLKIDSKHPTVLLFYSQTCPSCHDIKEPFNKYVTKHKGAINCAALDVNGAGVRDFVRMLKVESVPTVVIVHKHVGFFGDTALESYLNQMTGMTAFVQSSSSQPAEHIVSKDNADLEELEEEERYLAPTEKPLAVHPEEIADIDEELEMDVLVSDTNRPAYKARGDVIS